MNPLNVIRDAFYFFSRHILTIFVLCMPLIVLECLLRQWLDRLFEHESGYELLSGLLFYPLYTGALILFLDARNRGQSPSLRDLLAGSLLIWPRFALLSAISSLLVILAAQALLLPALWVMTKLAFAEYLLVLRGLQPLAAMRASYRLTVGHFWPLLACVLLVVGPLWPLNWWTASLFGKDIGWLPLLLVDSANGFVQLFSIVVLFRYFMLCEPSGTPPPGNG
jgi:hypothetical protein